MVPAAGAPPSAGFGRKPALLYDNDTDPHQQHNLLDNADSAHLQEQLKMAQSGWLHRVGEA
jgi:hypothetical protein